MTQRTGAHCFSCDLSLEQFHDPELVKQGLSMNVLTTDVNEIFNRIARENRVTEEDLDNYYIPSNEGDWQSRLGLKGRPVTDKIEVTRISSVLHRSTLRILTWLNQLISRLCTIQKWGRGNKFTDHGRKQFEKAWSAWMLVLGEVAGYRNLPCPNQMTGYLANRLFNESDRAGVVE